MPRPMLAVVGAALLIGPRVLPAQAPGSPVTGDAAPKRGTWGAEVALGFGWSATLLHFPSVEAAWLAGADARVGLQPARDSTIPPPHSRRDMILHALTVTVLAATQQSVDPLVSTAWLADRLHDPTIVVIHVDSRPERYDEGHIPGARFIRYGDIAPDGGLGAELPDVATLEQVLEAVGVSDDSHVVLYSVTRVLMATRLWFTLDYLGYGHRASVLDGGMAQWRAEGRPETREVPAVRPGSFTPRPRADVLVSAEWIHRRLDDQRLVLIDARPDDEYTGADGGMGGRLHPGHIPGAYQLYWEELVESADKPVFRPLSEMRTLFEVGGAGPEQDVVTYCMIGMRASLTYFVGRMLGYDMKFYDGSWHDWGARDLPYVTGAARRD